MRFNLQKGQGLLEGVLILAVLIVVVFLEATSHHPFGPEQGVSTGGTVSSYTVTGGSTTGGTITTPLTSTYRSMINLSSGNAPSAIQPSDEYVVLQNTGTKSLDVSGWQFQNGKGNRVYDVGGNEERFSSDTALVPRASGQDIILKPNDIAYVTTGAIGNQSPYVITSFKENECTGYIGTTVGYTFNPSLSASCVPPYQEPGQSSLDTTCQKFIQGLPSCQTPKFDTTGIDNYTTDSRGNTCFGCVNGTAGLSTSCVAFIKTHFSYQGCLAYHTSDPHFESNIWHIYLGKPWEMYAPDHEMISLFDASGRLAAQTSY